MRRALRGLGADGRPGGHATIAIVAIIMLVNSPLFNLCGCVGVFIFEHGSFFATDPLEPALFALWR